MLTNNFVQLYEIHITKSYNEIYYSLELDYRYMAHLHWERVRACLTCTPFNYPVRPYRMSLANYFIKGSEIHPHMGDFGVVTDIEGVDELQHQFHHL